MKAHLDLFDSLKKGTIRRNRTDPEKKKRAEGGPGICYVAFTNLEQVG